MQYIKWFKDLNKKDILIAGGKGANLGEMFDIFPIPDGFVITSNAFDLFIKTNNLSEKIYPILKKLNIENTEVLERDAAGIQSLIKEQDIPKEIRDEISLAYDKLKGRVAVRSSATAEDLPDASFAGQQASFLDVKGTAPLIKKVQECWASLFTARAIYYRATKGFEHEKVLMAVVVQKMVDSKKAGVIFTVNPVFKDKNQIIIEAALGLGETVVSGGISPDNYVVEKKPLKIKNKLINEQVWGLFTSKQGKVIKKDLLQEGEEQKLSDKEILDLAKIAMQIEQHYKFPQDIEFAIDDKIYIVQSRPITTL